MDGENSGKPGGPPLFLETPTSTHSWWIFSSQHTVDGNQKSGEKTSWYGKLSTIIYDGFYTSFRWIPGFLNHQQYVSFPEWTKFKTNLCKNPMKPNHLVAFLCVFDNRETPDGRNQFSSKEWVVDASEVAEIWCSNLKLEDGNWMEKWVDFDFDLLGCFLKISTWDPMGLNNGAQQKKQCVCVCVCFF